MIEQLSQMQARIHTMREAILNEGSVLPEEESIITSLEAKKNVVWYLDLLAAAVAGAHRHMSNVEHDDFLSAMDKERMQTRIVELLHQDLGWLNCTVKSLDHRWDWLASELDEASRLGHTREAALCDELEEVDETLGQLTMLLEEVRDMLHALGVPLT